MTFQTDPQAHYDRLRLQRCTTQNAKRGRVICDTHISVLARRDPVVLLDLSCRLVRQLKEAGTDPHCYEVDVR